MVKVRDRVKISQNGKIVEAVALFDTGASRSYIDVGVAEKVGYERYPEPRRVPLAVQGAEAEVVGYIPAADVEVAGCMLPEKETLGVIEGLREEAVIGLNIIESYNIILEKDKIRLKEYPPSAQLI